MFGGQLTAASRFSGVRFGSGPANAGEPVKIGLVKTLRVLHQYFKVAENQQILKGLLFQYGIPAAIGLSFFAPPLGWIIGGLGILPSIYFSRKGEKIIGKLVEEGKLDRTHGPLARVTSIHTTYQNAVPGDGRKIISEYNRLLEELLVDNPSVKNLGAIRRKLQMAEEGRLARFLNHVFNVKLHYSTRWQGKLLKKIQGVSNHIPIKIIKLPLVAASLLLQGLLVVFSHKKMLNVGGNALRRLV